MLAFVSANIFRCLSKVSYFESENCGDNKIVFSFFNVKSKLNALTSMKLLLFSEYPFCNPIKIFKLKKPTVVLKVTASGNFQNKFFLQSESYQLIAKMAKITYVRRADGLDV